MKARQIIERLAAPAPAPTKPATRPGAPAPTPKAPPPRPKKYPNPFRRREIRPGEEPAPKACRESKARDLLNLE